MGHLGAGAVCRSAPPPSCPFRTAGTCTVLEFYSKKYSVSKLVGLTCTIERENASKGENALYNVK